MAIINRLARLFKADLHAVLDHIEEPELQLKQAIREMDEQLQINNSDIKRIQSQLSDLLNRRTEAQTLLEKTNAEIKLCFENDNETLAKGLIRRKLETTAIIQSLVVEHDAAEKQRRTLEKESEEFSTLLSSMQQKASLMATQTTPTHVHSESLKVNDSDVEVALLQERQRFETQSNAS